MRRRWFLWTALCAALGGAPAAAHAAPILELGRLPVLPPVTLGDTLTFTFAVGNTGDAPLTVSGIDATVGVRFEPEPPFTIDPQSTSVGVLVRFAPHDTTATDVVLTIHSNDPAQPTVPVALATVVLPPTVDTAALTAGGLYPLGEAIVVQSVPRPNARIEKVTLYYRTQGLLQFQTMEMARNGGWFVAIIPGVSVTEGGLDLYTVAENSEVATFAPPAGPDRPLRVDVASPQNFELDPVVRNPGFVWKTNEAVDFLLKLQRGTEFQSGLLHYRMGGEKRYAETDILEMSFTGIAATIPADRVGPRGVVYWSEVQTLTRLLANPQEGDKQPYELRVTVERMFEDRTHPAGRYRLVSVPLEWQSTTGLSAILSDEDEFGSYDPTRWRAFRYLPAAQANVELPADADAFVLQPGRAFWLITRSPHRIDTGPVPGVSLSSLEPRRIVLAPGWNAIGNPFAFPVAWTSVVAPSEISEPLAFDSDRNDYAERPAAVLVPFEGYFVENVSAEAETILVKPEAVDSSEVALRVASEPAVASGLRIEARSAGGADRSTWVGVAADASDERDPRDQSKPPAPPDSRPRAAVANRDWIVAPGLYARDFRRADAQGHRWSLEITSPEGGVPVEVTVHPEGPIPAGSALRLIDLEQGTATDLDPAAGPWRHSIVAFDAERPYRLALLMGSPTYLEDGEAGPIPGALRLDPVSPNPGAAAQRVRFGLPRRARARLEVFDATGRRVALLHDGVLPAGFHAFVWRPGTGRERPASGVYFHRLTVDGETRTARSVLVR